MPILDFPANPTPGEQYLAPNNVTYTWDGAREAWTAAAGGGPAPGEPSINTPEITYPINNASNAGTLGGVTIQSSAYTGENSPGSHAGTDWQVYKGYTPFTSALPISGVLDFPGDPAWALKEPVPGKPKKVVGFGTPSVISPVFSGLFIAYEDVTFYYSSTNGDSWVQFAPSVSFPGETVDFFSGSFAVKSSTSCEVYFPTDVGSSSATVIRTSLTLPFIPYATSSVLVSISSDWARVRFMGSNGGMRLDNVKLRQTTFSTPPAPQDIDVGFGTSAIRAGSSSLVVGDNGKIATSLDGIQWTLRSSGTTQTLRCIGSFTPDAINATSGFSTILVGGDNGTLLYSTDGGLTWQTSSSAAAVFGSNAINSITSTTDYIMAVGGNGVNAYSRDGITWTAMSPLPNNVVVAFQNRFTTLFTPLPGEPFQFWAITSANSSIYRKKAYPQGYNLLTLGVISPFGSGDMVNNGLSGPSSASGRISCFDGNVNITNMFVSPYSDNWAVGQYLSRGIPVVDVENSSSLTSLAVGKPPLISNYPYYVRSRYKSNSSPAVVSNWSAWSLFYPTAFTREIGSAYQGGFYAGQTKVGSTTYDLIVAPKATGEAVFAYKTANTAESNPAVSQRLDDGDLATSAYNDSSHPAFQWASGLTIGGYSDWYIPSRNEMEVITRNLGVVNATSGTRAIQDGPLANVSTDDFSTVTNVNQTSLPLGRSRNSPLGSGNVTAAPLFNSKAGYLGSEAVSFPWYWTSTEYSGATTNAWSYNTGYGGSTGSTGNQDISRVKSSVGWARAVRKVPVVLPNLGVINGVENFPLSAWEAETFPPLTVTERVMAIQFEIGSRLAVVLENTRILYTSVFDNNPWVLGTPPVAGQTVSAACATKGGGTKEFAAITTGSSIKLLVTRLAFIGSGINWEDQITITGPFTPRSIAAFSGNTSTTVVMGGDNGVMKRYNSGGSGVVTDIVSPFGTSAVLSIDCSSNGDLWVAVGENGKIATSTNSIDWTLRTAGTTETLNSVSVGGSSASGYGVHVVGNNCTFRSSSNSGLSWSNATPAAITTLFGSQNLVTNFVGTYPIVIGASGTAALFVGGAIGSDWIAIDNAPPNVKWCTGLQPTTVGGFVTEGAQFWIGTNSAAGLYSKSAYPYGMTAVRVVNPTGSAGVTVNNGIVGPGAASGKSGTVSIDLRTPGMSTNPTPPLGSINYLYFMEPADADWLVGQTLYLS